MIFVEKCENWHQEYLTRGRHCFNCIMRDGFPQRAQPSKACKNFKPKPKQISVTLEQLDADVYQQGDWLP